MYLVRIKQCAFSEQDDGCSCSTRMASARYTPNNKMIKAIEPPVQPIQQTESIHNDLSKHDESIIVILREYTEQQISFLVLH